MRKQVFVLAGIVLAVAGCGKTPFPVMESALSDLKGQPVNVVYPKIGDPSSQGETAGEKYYVWLSSKSAPPYSFGDTVSLNCTVKIFVDKQDNITHYDFNGNVAGCSHFAHRLDKSYNLVHWN